MDKIKINIEYFKNNKVAINCKSLEETEELNRLLKGCGVIEEEMSIFYFGFNRYGQNVCYEYQDGYIYFGSEVYYKNQNYEILDFTGFNGTQFCNKTTILTEDIELKNGDIINTKDYGYGMVINDIIIYAKHYGWDEIENVIDNITEYLPFDILKQQSFYEEDKGIIIQDLLFNSCMEDEIKSLMIKVEEPTPKTKTKIYYVSRNKYSLSYTDKYISDEVLNLKDMCYIDTGLLKGKYGRIIAVNEDELTEEEISKYDKISSVGELYN